MRALEEFRVADEKIANAVVRLPFADHGKSQGVAQRNAEARNQHRVDLVAVIARQQNGYFVPHLAQRFGQRFDNVRQTACF